MRHELYLNFYEILKRFIEEEKFSIEYEIFGEKYEIVFDKKNKNFYYKDGNKLFPKKEDVYKVIKDYVEKIIIKKQKDVFNGTFELNNKKYFLDFESEKEMLIFIDLVNNFKKFLCDEPIYVYDFDFSNIFDKIQYGFSDSKVEKWFIAYILYVIKRTPKILQTGIISEDIMWKKTIKNDEIYLNELCFLKEEKYVIVKMESEEIKVSLTEKFYEAFKKCFWYDYEPLNLLNLK